MIHQQNHFTNFPKGHVEPGETEVATAIRETKEETNLDIIVDPTHRYTVSYYIDHLDVQKEVVLFLAQLKNPDQTLIKQDSEIASLSWVPLDQVADHLEYDEWRQVWQRISADLTALLA